ncbi:SGNH/GDSL hydrolase family protein [Paracoccus sp. (in: a-proteobacteria)]|uniref:SGNH/GDSL hydrolase family protein n=1 Tax=Paracoccus sp. TaxID=267 RepID=UPI002896C9ED|nr:SGNH/GDSL hydrolase family protein [Paracoccus sp. (in: a-proteobacteria)]
MPAPTFDLAVTGTAPNQLATEAGLEAGINAALLATWNGVLANAGKSFRSRAEAVAFGQENLPVSLGAITVLEGGALVSRVPGNAAGEDNLFSTYPQWSVALRIDAAELMGQATSNASAIGGILTPLLIGPPSFYRAATAVLQDRVYVFDRLNSVANRAAWVRFHAHEAGTVLVKMFARNGDNFSQIGADIPVPAKVGVNIIPAEFDVPAGCYVGFYAPGIVSHSNGTGIGFFEGVSGNEAAFTDPTPATTRIINFSLEMSTVVRSTDSQVAQEFGIYNMPFNPSSPVQDKTFVFAGKAAADCVIRTVKLTARAAGKVAVKIFTRDDASGYCDQFGEDIWLTAEAGENLFSGLAITVPKGGMLGVYGVGVLGHAPGAVQNPATQAFYENTSGNSSSFMDATAASTTSLCVGASTIVETASLGVSSGVIDAAVAVDAMTILPSVTLGRSGVRRGRVTGAVMPISPPAFGMTRYDLLVFDMAASTFSVLNGVERTVGYAISQPKAALPSQKPIAVLKVTDATVSPVMVHDVIDGEISDLAADLEVKRARNRALIPRTIHMIRGQRPLRMLGFGDSLTAIQGGAVSTTEINGANRDYATAPLTNANHYLRDGYSDEVVDALPLYTSVQLGRADDGAGQIHSRIGINWEVVAALERAGYALGVDLWYDNLGWSGRATAAAVSGTTPTEWLEAAKATVADLVIVGLGMNERGNAGTQGRMVIIINELIASGKEVIVLDCPRPRNGNYYEWQYTTEALRGAAEFCEVPFVSYGHLAAGANLRSFGMHSSDVCEANRINHPGLLELAGYGREVSKLLLG